MKLRNKFLLGSALVVGSFSAFAAADHSAAITAATDSAALSVTAVVTGIIALAAIVTGVGIVISMLKR